MTRLFAVLCLLGRFASAASVPVLRWDGPLNPGAEDYLTDGLEEAGRMGAPFVVFALEGEGGLMQTTRSMVQRILESPIPVVVYLGPAGYRADGLRALCLLAADVGAMAPGAKLLATSAGVPEEDRHGWERFESETAEFADSLARSRGRLGTAAAKAIRSKEGVSGEEAVKEGLVDLAAEDVPSLLAKLPGLKLRVARSLSTLPAGPVEPAARPAGAGYRFLSLLARPQLAFALLLLGFLCLWIELAHPGRAWLPAVGSTLVLFSLFSFYWLPISYGALALVVAGLGLLVVEGFVAAYGLFALGGIASFVGGSLYLMDSTAPDFEIGLAVVLPTAACLAAAGLALSYLVIRDRRRRRRANLETLVGEFGESRAPISKERGKVFVQGELWNATVEGGGTIDPGAIVVVTGVRGLSLIVSPR